jgi:hypothetical protein
MPSSFFNWYCGGFIICICIHLRHVKITLKAVIIIGIITKLGLVLKIIDKKNAETVATQEENKTAFSISILVEDAI